MKNSKNNSSMENSLLKRKYSPAGIFSIFNLGILIYVAQYNIVLKVIFYIFFILYNIGLLNVLYYFNKKDFRFIYFVNHHDVLLKWIEKPYRTVRNILNFVLAVGIFLFLAFLINDIFLSYFFIILYFEDYILLAKIMKTASYEHVNMMDNITKKDEK